MENLYQIAFAHTIAVAGGLLACVVEFCIFYKKRKKSLSASKKSTFAEKGMWNLVQSIISFCIFAVLLVNYTPIMKDIISPQTETVIGTVLGWTGAKNGYKDIRIETDDGELRLAGTSLIIDEFDIDYDSTYEFEYFINSKTIKKAKLLKEN